MFARLLARTMTRSGKGRLSRRRKSMFGKIFKATALATAAVMVWATAALADNVQNDVEMDLNADKIVTITKGDATGANVGLRIAANSGDGQAACNAEDATSATVGFTSGVPTGVTVNPSTRSYTTCSTYQYFNFTAGAAAIAGDYLMEASASDLGVGTYNTNPSQFTLRIVAGAPADTAAPTITITTPGDGATYFLNQVVNADYSCADEVGGSGLKSCVGPVASGAAIDTSSVGPKSFKVDAEDNAGNKSSLTHNYNVAFKFSGFFAPVDNPTWVNKVKAGQAIPLKWRLLDANDVPYTTLSSATMSVAGFTCSLGTTIDELEEVAAGASGLQNLGDGYYQLNWKSPTSYAKSCKTLKLDIGEGSTHNANFEFTK
jgi:hypothetical protein